MFKDFSISHILESFQSSLLIILICINLTGGYTLLSSLTLVPWFLTFLSKTKCSSHQSVPLGVTIIWFINTGAQCDQGWLEHNAQCYMYVEEKLAQQDAFTECEQRRSQLVEIYTNDELWLLCEYGSLLCGDPLLIWLIQKWIGVDHSQTFQYYQLLDIRKRWEIKRAVIFLHRCHHQIIYHNLGACVGWSHWAMMSQELAS